MTILSGMNHITLAVTDIERAFHFYHEILELKPLCKWDHGAYFLIDNFWFCLNVDNTHQPTPGYTHYAFSVSEDNFDALHERITKSGAHIFKDNTSPGNSLYFLDPDGHKLEIHVGSWKIRVDEKKKHLGSWSNVKWYV